MPAMPALVLDREVPLSALGIDPLAPPQPVGAGGFGRVYKGRYRATDVAIKMILVTGSAADDVKALDDFRKEIELVLSLAHPNLVRAMAAHTTPPNLALVFEWMAGGSLADVLYGKSKRELSLRQRFSIAIDICSGLSFLHGGKPEVIHRDLKPENVMLDEHLTAKLTDFGMSRVKLHSELGTRIGGTAVYMAPGIALSFVSRFCVHLLLHCRVSRWRQAD